MKRTKHQEAQKKILLQLKFKSLSVSQQLAGRIAGCRNCKSFDGSHGWDSKNGRMIWCSKYLKFPKHYTVIISETIYFVSELRDCEKKTYEVMEERFGEKCL